MTSLIKHTAERQATARERARGAAPRRSRRYRLTQATARAVVWLSILAVCLAFG